MGTDQPFKSISIGAVSQVWAIAKDGSAFYRGSVSSENPAGKRENKIDTNFIICLQNWEQNVAYVSLCR